MLESAEETSWFLQRRRGVKTDIEVFEVPRMAIVLPDQAPKEGDGVFAPFFGHEVLTPVLPYRLAIATDAVVFIGAALKRGHSYEIVLRQMPAPMDHDQHYMAHLDESRNRKFSPG